MKIYEHSPSEDRQAWFDLSSDLGDGMEQLGWHVYNHLPEPWTPAMWRAVRYHDLWENFAWRFAAELPPAIEHWCFSGGWPALTDSAAYLLQLRIYVALRFIEGLYVGPGREGETLIPFPRHVSPPNLRRWWLTTWFDDEGRNVLFREMTLRWWTQHKSMFSPANRQQLGLASQQTWHPPKYRPYGQP